MQPPQVASLTRLVLGIPWLIGGDEPLRWCSSLPELRTLRELHLRIASVDKLCVDDLVEVLPTLPSLDQLHMHAASAVDLEAPPLTRLIAGVCDGLPGLRALSLQRCFKTERGRCPSREGQQAIAELAKLTSLTRVSLQNSTVNCYVASMLADVLTSAVGLRDVCASNMSFGPHMVAKLCCRLAPHQLRSVDVGHTGRSPLQVLMPCVQPDTGGGLAQVTALDLAWSGICAQEGERLATLLGGMTALGSLNLEGNRLGKEGMQGFASDASHGGADTAGGWGHPHEHAWPPRCAGLTFPPGRGNGAGNAATGHLGRCAFGDELRAGCARETAPAAGELESH